MKRRQPNGRSSIHLGSDGRWHGYVSMGKDVATGRPVRKHVRGRSQAEVAAKVVALEKKRSMAIGKAAVAGRLTVGAWVEEWLAQVKGSRRVRTWQVYRSILKRHLGPLEDLALDDLSVAMVDSLLRRVAESVSPRSAANLHRTLRACLSVAVKRGLLVGNAAKLATVPRVEEVEVEPLTLDEAQRVVEVASGLRNEARWTVALALGLRQGEALGLQWRDIDLHGGTLTVARQLQRHEWQHGCETPCGLRAARCPARQGGGLRLVPYPKSRAGRRTIALTPKLVEALRRQKSAQLKDQVSAALKWHDLDFVFARVDGKPMDPSADNRAWHELLEAARVPDKRLHDARHTAATILLAQGVDGRVVMQILGWSQTALLARYQHVNLELSREAIGKVTSALLSEGGER